MHRKILWIHIFAKYQAQADADTWCWLIFSIAIDVVKVFPYFVQE